MCNDHYPQRQNESSESDLEITNPENTTVSSYDFTPYSGQINDPYGDFYLDRETCKIVHDMIVTDSPKCAEVEEYANIVIEEAKKYFSEIEIDAGLQESFPFFIWFIYYKIKQRGLAYE